MLASSADMCDLKCKEAFSKNIQNRHVGLKCGLVRFMVKNGALKNHLLRPCEPLVRTCAIYGANRRFRKTLKIVMCASSADMSNSWSKMVLSRITYFDHVGL